MDEVRAQAETSRSSPEADLRGNGDVLLLFIPGLLGRAEDWNDVRTLLGTRFTTSAYTPRALSGIGESGDPEWSLDAALAELQSVIDALPPQPLVLVGASIGGTVALAFAANSRRPGAVVTLGTAPRWLGNHEWPFGPDADSAAGLIRNLRSDFIGTFESMLPVIWTNDDRSGTVSALYQARARALRDPQYLVTALEQAYTVDLRSELHRLTMPVLLLHGEVDALLPAAAAEATRALLPDASVQVIDRAGHLAMLTAPAAVAGAIAGFVSHRLPAGASG